MNKGFYTSRLLHDCFELHIVILSLPFLYIVPYLRTCAGDYGFEMKEMCFQTYLTITYALFILQTKFSTTNAEFNGECFKA